jgi:hypothetical protein
MEFPPSIDLDASPDVQRHQLAKLCPACVHFGDGGPPVDGAISSVPPQTINTQPPSAAPMDGGAACTVNRLAAHRGLSEAPVSMTILAALAVWARRRREGATH